jgi:hypothetical protein
MERFANGQDHLHERRKSEALAIVLFGILGGLEQLGLVGVFVG